MFGSKNWDEARGVTVDGQGNVYVVGMTQGALPGQTSTGSGDAYLRKYNAAGEEVWTRQFGSIRLDLAESVIVDSGGNIYVAGWTLGAFPGQATEAVGNAFLLKYDPAGVELWVSHFGNGLRDEVRDVTLDGEGNVFVAGTTILALADQKYLGHEDAFLRKYDAAGEHLWTRQFGSATNDGAYAVVADGERGF